VGEPGEFHSGSTKLKAADSPAIQNPATLSGPKDDSPQITAQGEYKSPEASTSKEIIEGKVIGIVDGDTFDLLDDSNKTYRIRMEGIDAPEKGMPFYQVSKKHLGSLCFGQRVALQITQTESGNRKIGFTYLSSGNELSHEMIRAGLAWHFVKYNSDRDLAALEEEARKERMGLWKDPNPLPPWEIRKIRRSGQSTKQLFNISEDQS
jgi:endonuclease YncB( thermonuclease family)